MIIQFPNDKHYIFTIMNNIKRNVPGLLRLITDYRDEFEKLLDTPITEEDEQNYKSELRQWENSDDITQKYLIIYKNRKQIKNKLSDNNFIIHKSGRQYVKSDTLILVIQKMLPNCKLSRIQWKMITNIGKGPNVDNLVCLSDFFKLIEIATKKNNNFKPYNTSSEFNKIYYGNFESPKISTKN